MTNNHLQRCRLTVICLLALCLTGCATRQPVLYYNLTPMTAGLSPQVLAADYEAMALEIRPVLLPEAIDRAQIASRLDPQRLTFNDFHRWSGPLADDVTSVLLEDIAAQLPARNKIALFPRDSYFQPTHRLLVNISRFDGKAGDEVALTARWTVIKVADKEPLISRKSTIQVKAAGDDQQALVTAHSQAVADLARDIVAALAGR